jgi:hypothetical protein
MATSSVSMSTHELVSLMWLTPFSASFNLPSGFCILTRWCFAHVALPLSHQFLHWHPCELCWRSCSCRSVIWTTSVCRAYSYQRNIQLGDYWAVLFVLDPSSEQVIWWRCVGTWTVQSGKICEYRVDEESDACLILVADLQPGYSQCNYHDLVVTVLDRHRYVSNSSPSNSARNELHHRSRWCMDSALSYLLLLPHIWWQKLVYRACLKLGNAQFSTVPRQFLGDRKTGHIQVDQ